MQEVKEKRSQLLVNRKIMNCVATLSMPFELLVKSGMA